MSLTTREFLKSAGVAALTAAGGCQGISWLAAAQARRLNILYIMTDDHAAHAISAYGSRINKTPYIDALAEGGALLTNCLCTNPICAPSRGGILTGLYSHRNGVPTFNALSPQIKTIGGYLRDAGYATAFIGKWHLGGPETMRDADWNKWMIYGGQGVYFDPWFWRRSPATGKFEKKVYKGEYATENITRVTQATINELAVQDPGKPFFVMMHHKAPHRNWLPSDKYRAQFRSLTLKDIPMPETLFDDWKGRASPIRTTAMTLLKHMRPELDLKATEFFVKEGRTFTFEGRTWTSMKGMDNRTRTAFAYLRYMQDYLACVQSVDDSVGEMTAYLKAKDLFDKTLVVYTSDQGFFLGDHGLYDKRFMMEEVVKMPMVLSCPALIKPGTVNRDLVTNIDFAPTFLDLADAPVPAAMQGRSFLANLVGHTPDDWRTAVYCRYYVEGGEHQTAAWYGVQTKRDKLIYYYKRNEWEYFDLTRDSEELTNGYADPKNQNRIAQLKQRLAQLRAELGDNDRYANAPEYGRPQS